MKKGLILTFLMGLFLLISPKVSAMNYEDAVKDSKPVAILIYADWAEDLDNVMKSFDSMKAQYVNTYNFVYLNIADPDTKAFNKTNHIYSNLPYVLLMKKNGKMTRYLQKQCVKDDACFSDRLSIFKE